MGPVPEGVKAGSAGGGATLLAACRRGEGREAVAGAPVFTAFWLDGRMLRARSEVDGAGPGAGGGGICWADVRRDRTNAWGDAGTELRSGISESEVRVWSRGGSMEGLDDDVSGSSNAGSSSAGSWQCPVAQCPVANAQCPMFSVQYMRLTTRLLGAPCALVGCAGVLYYK